MRLTANAIARRRRAAGERQHVDAVVAGDLQRHRAGDRAGAELQVGGLALVMTLTSAPGCCVAVPKLAWLMCSALIAVVSTPLVT